MKKNALLFFLLLPIGLSAQVLTGEEIFLKVIKNIQSIPAYTSNIDIKVDVDFIKIKDRSGKVTFTPPDKFDYNFSGFALMPKESPFKQLMDNNNERFTILDMDMLPLDGKKFRSLKLIPNNPEDELILSQLWIDQNAKIRKILVYTKDRGKVESVIDYISSPYPLPGQIEVSFDIKKAKLPPGMDGDFAKIMQQEETIKETKGRIILNYSNYQF